MTPAIDDMSVREERQCLNEIREFGKGISPDHVLKNGWRAGDFALKYTMGHHEKRQRKGKSGGEFEDLQS